MIGEPPNTWYSVGEIASEREQRAREDLTL